MQLGVIVQNGELNKTIKLFLSVVIPFNKDLTPGPVRKLSSKEKIDQDAK